MLSTTPMEQAPPLPLHTGTDDPVWAALLRYEPGPDDVALPFVRRLARESGWRDTYAARVLDEYRRFCLLAIRAGHPVTPSDAVDQAWHLHLGYTRDYWERFCPEVLGRPLHHEPTAGGPAESARFFEQYACTLASYERLFGEGAPADIWPDARRRLFVDPNAMRVHPHAALIVPRRWLHAALLATAMAALLILLARSF